MPIKSLLRFTWISKFYVELTQPNVVDCCTDVISVITGLDVPYLQRTDVTLRSDVIIARRCEIDPPKLPVIFNLRQSSDDTANILGATFVTSILWNKILVPAWGVWEKQKGKYILKNIRYETSVSLHEDTLRIIATCGLHRSLHVQWNP